MPRRKSKPTVAQVETDIATLIQRRSDAAKSILGMAITRGGDTLQLVLERVKTADMPAPHIYVFRAMREVASRSGAGTGIDPALIRQALVGMEKPELGNGFLGSLLSDHAGLSVEEQIVVLEETTKKLADMESEFDEAAHAEANKRRLTDAGNAGRLIWLHGRDLKWSVADKQWIVWTGQRWQTDKTGEVERRCLDTVKSIYEDGLKAKDGLRQILMGWALECEESGRLNSMKRCAWYLPGVPVQAHELDADPWLLNCRNGTLNLKTGQLRGHRREDYCTRMAATDYDPEAKCPTFDSFIKKITQDRPGLISYLQRVLGSALSGDVSEQKAYLLVGVGANGKSTLLNCMYDVLADYAKPAPTDALLSKRRDDHPTAIAGLRGARFVGARENDEGRKLAEGLLKELTGGDKIAGRMMYHDYDIEYTPSFKLFLGLNHAPTVTDNTHSMWRRLKVLPFDVVIPDNEQDKRLPEKLRAELPGVLAWLVRGCLDWQKDGLAEPHEVTEATTKYRCEQDVVRAFFDECCRVTDSDFATVGDVYLAYKQWATVGGEKKPLGKTTFNKRLEGHGFKKLKRNTGLLWEGLRVLDAYKYQPPAADPESEKVKS